MTFLSTEPVAVLIKKETLTSKNKLRYLGTKKVISKMCIKFLEESQQTHAYCLAAKYRASWNRLQVPAESVYWQSIWPRKQALIQPENPVWKQCWDVTHPWQREIPKRASRFLSKYLGWVIMKSFNKSISL